MRTPLAALLSLTLALPGCGTKPVPEAGADENATSIAIAPDEEPGPTDEPAGITAIDAASGDARAMPADSTAPSAYDLAQRAERAKDAEARREARAAPGDTARLETPANLSAGDGSVSAGD